MVPFGYVLLFGAPYLPTRQKTAELALDMLNLKKGQHLVDLGSGDGAVLIAAAKRGIYATGYELNPIVFAISYMRCLRYRRYISLKLGNFWNQSIPQNTDAVFIFLLERFMTQLDDNLNTELKQGTKVVSYTFSIPNKEIKDERQALYLYSY